MSQSAVRAAGASVWNVPNLVTVSRLALALVLFVLLAFGLYTASLVVFIVAAGTDWIDGYWARKYGQVTQLGRILDPFADKLIVCGAFIFLAAGPHLDSGFPASGVAAWMAVVIVGRELGVTALRSFVETRGGDFSAKWAGKLKMLVQCVAAAFSMGALRYFDAAERAMVGGPPAWIALGLGFSLWAAIVLTIYSGAEYVFAAAKMLREAE